MSEWQPGSGANDGGAWQQHRHREIEPYEPGRAPSANFTLLSSALIPRPVTLISTVSADGNLHNLVPMSYSQLVGADPPLFVVGVAGGFNLARDALRSLVETGECTINLVSEHIIDAVNACMVNPLSGVSEWNVTGLTPGSSKAVRARRVCESIVSIEGKVLSTTEYESRSKPGTKSSGIAVVEGVRFWVREDAVDAAGSTIDPAVSSYKTSQPVSLAMLPPCADSINRFCALCAV